MSNTRDLTPEERTRAEAALGQAIDLCRLLLDGDADERKLLLQQAFQTRISDPAMAGYEHDYANIIKALENLKDLPGAFVLDALPEQPEHVAYVYSDDPRHVYLHDRFFEQQPVRMARTLVHEAAQWDCVRDADADASGRPACRELSYTLYRWRAEAFGMAVEQLATQRGIR